ncbi:unnamed protein product [Lathyrus sativus]|nr:unnamed protein product [Lathyrus sativus]
MWDPYCDFCNGVVEIVLHVFRDCWAANLWRNLRIHNSDFVLPVCLAADIKTSWLQYAKAMLLKKRMFHFNQNRERIKWQSTDINWVTIRMDGMVCHSGNNTDVSTHRSAGCGDMAQKAV